MQATNNSGGTLALLLGAIPAIGTIMTILYRKSTRAEDRAGEAKVIAAHAQVIGAKAHDKAQEVDTFKAQLEGTRQLVELNREWLERQERKIAEQEGLLKEQTQKLQHVSVERDECQVGIAHLKADLKVMRAEVALFKEVVEGSRDFTPAEREAVKELTQEKEDERK